MTLAKKYWHIILLILAIIPGSIPLLTNGFYEPHDLHHLADIHQMFRAFETGQFPPRLGPDFTWGFGYPLFHFYYVLPFYLGAFYYWLFGSLTWAFKLVFLTSIAISIFGMFAFLRLYLGKIASFCGSFLFLYTPYRAVQLYVRGAMGEALSLAILPWVAWSLVRLIRNTNRKNFSLFVLILSAYLLTHNYLWVLALPFLGILALGEIYKQKHKLKPFFVLFLSALSSLLVTIYWWLPALLDQKLVAEKTPFLLADHFPFLKQLLIPSWGYGSSVWGPGDEISFQLGIVNVTAILFLGIFFLSKKTTLKSFFLAAIALAGFAISLAFMNIRTYFIWRIIPFYDFIQFPWRLLFLTGFFSSVSTGIVVENIKYKKVFTVIVILTSLVLTLGYFKPSKIVFTDDDYYLDRFFNDPNYSEDYLLLPKWSEVRPSMPISDKVQLESGEILSLSRKNDLNYKIATNSESPDLLTFYSYYFPGWRATVDGVEAKIVPGKPYGQITLPLTEGEHEINIFWAETQARKVMDYISALSLVIVTAIFASGFLLPRKR